jgi:NhaP-type Na+/H+ or K+/H+ antiporter
LPPIIFSGGYNLQKRRFFKNFTYIVIYGLCSTLLNFGITVGLTVAINEGGLIKRWGHFSDEPIKLSTSYLMLFSATICATDSVAALAMIKPEKYPKLFSVLFGEGNNIIQSKEI